MYTELMKPSPTCKGWKFIEPGKPDKSLLMVAVSDVRVDGVRLEGVGVAPDVMVGRSIPFSEGRDEQLDAGVADLLSTIDRQPPR
mgnify:CR=1 FL=1